MVDGTFDVDEESRLEIEQTIEEYEKQAGVWGNGKVNIPLALQMSMEELRKKTPEQLVEFSIEIGRYSLYIQRLANWHYGWDRWATSKLNELAAHYLPELDTHYGFNEREILAKNTSEICKTLNKFIRENRMKMDRLKDVPQHIDKMADHIRDMKFIALSKEKQYAGTD